MDDRLDQARSHAAAGMQALQARNGKTALGELETAIRLGWPGPDVWVALGHARALTGDVPGRFVALKKALEIDPDNVRALLYFGDMHANRGDRPSAEAAYRKALSGVASLPARTGEIDGLVAMAEKYLGEAAPAETEDPLDRFARQHRVGDHADDLQFSQSLDMLAGRSQRYPPRPTKYFYPGLPTREFYPLDGHDWAGAVAANAPEIRGELQSLLERQTQEASRFSPYVEATGREGDAVSHPMIGNPDWSAFYLIKQGKRIEENIALCPQTMAAIDAIGADAEPAPGSSVLFSLLEPGASIPPHHGALNTRLICHLPIILPGECGFRVGNTVREWTDGEIFIFDDTIEHEAWNRSDRPRYVLIWEIWRPELTTRQRELVSALFDMALKGG